MKTQWISSVFIQSEIGGAARPGVALQIHLVRRSSRDSMTASDTASEGARKRTPIRNLIVLHSRQEGRVASKVRCSHTSSHPCHDVFPKAHPNIGATEDRFLTAVAVCTATDRGWGNPAVTHRREGNLGTGCAALVFLRDEAGHARRHGDSARTLPRAPKRHITHTAVTHASRHSRSGSVV